jgi:hypothetical protein
MKGYSLTDGEWKRRRGLTDFNLAPELISEEVREGGRELTGDWCVYF